MVEYYVIHAMPYRSGAERTYNLLIYLEHLWLFRFQD